MNAICPPECNLYHDHTEFEPSDRRERAGHLIQRAAARRRRRYKAWQAHPDYLTREHPALLVREASMLTDRLYALWLGAVQS